MKRLGVALAAFITLAPAAAQEIGRESGLPLPRWDSLRFSESNLRRGPGRAFPVGWRYQRKSLPLRVIDEYDFWRKVQDSEGVEGWLHVTQLSGARTAIATAEQAVLRARADETSDAVAVAESGYVMRIERCAP